MQHKNTYDDCEGEKEVIPVSYGLGRGDYQEMMPGVLYIGVGDGGQGAAPPPKFGQKLFFSGKNRVKIWASC